MGIDAPRWAVGAEEIPEDTKGNLEDSSLTPDERISKFAHWVSAYYSHPDFVSKDISKLQHVPDLSERPGTTYKMSLEEIKAVTSFETVHHSENPCRKARATTYAERVRRALFDDKNARTWQALQVTLIWCENSIWVAMDAAWTVEKRRESATKAGITGRPLRIVMMPAANHFVSAIFSSVLWLCRYDTVFQPHWDVPQRTMQFFEATLHR